ncbi:MAG: DUF4194 domain-containing protein [Planctomycetaceae bacterium]|nr:DUF4194 domain-containing protein [Planctomycetaceae bacterium]
MSDFPEFRERGIVAVHLLQGVVDEKTAEVWAILLSNESYLRDYFYEIGLVLVIDREEGIAYLRQMNDDERTGGYERIPRLFKKSALGYQNSLLTVLLREEYRRFEEEDLDNERCVVDTDEILEHWKSFFPNESDEVSLRKKLVTAFNHLEKLKFVRKIKSETDKWEVEKLLKARVPLEELESLRNRLVTESNPKTL